MTLPEIPKPKRLIDVLPERATAGIFQAFPAGRVPWNDDPEILDAGYIGHSGQKITSPLVDLYIDAETGLISAENLNRLALIILAYYGESWNRVYTALTSDYDPLENYNMRETEQSEANELRTPNISHTRQGSNTEMRSPNLTTAETGTESETTTPNKTTTTQQNGENVNSEAGRYGFNSATVQPTTTNSETANLTSTQTETGTEQRQGNKSTSRTETGTEQRQGSESQTETETGTESNAKTGSRTLSRRGNIGVTTSQQMLESEINIRKYHFFEVVYSNIDTILTSPLY